jgi:hypothetical protein
LASPDFNIILIPASPNILSYSKSALSHEVTHLLVREAVFGPYGDIPTWLNEGIAQYTEETLPEKDLAILDKASKENSLISIRSFSGGYPADSHQARLAYAESASFTAYLINTFGWKKIDDLLTIFKDGNTYDKALIKVYLKDTNALDREWRDWLKHQ